jgi:hypothetical protein
MTAKQALIEIIEGWSEDEAEKWLCAIEPERVHRDQQKYLTAEELLRLPASERSSVIKAQLALVTPEELQEELEEWEEWEAGTGSDIKLIDE